MKVAMIYYKSSLLYNFHNAVPSGISVFKAVKEILETVGQVIEYDVITVETDQLWK